MFTLFSIISCVLEYFTTSRFVKSRTIVFLQIFVESITIGQMNSYQFRKEIINRQRQIVHTVKRVLQIAARQMDLLKPKQDTDGVMLMFLLQIDETQFRGIQKHLHRGIEQNSLQNELKTMLNFTKKESITLKYGECVQAAQLRNEIILGLQIHADRKDRDKMFGIALIPDKNDEFEITEKDGLIALAEDET